MSAYLCSLFIFGENKRLMKKLFAFSIVFLLFSCKKETTNTNTKTAEIDSTKIIDSINASRLKHNDSIRNKPRFALLSGTHTLTHNMISGSGKVTFTKVEGNNDEYNIDGKVSSGKNSLTIKGYALRVGEKYFNFYGKITQSIQEYDNGKADVRDGGKHF